MNVIVKNRTLLVEIGENRENGLYISTVYDENQHGDPRDHGYSLPDIEIDLTEEEDLLKLLMARKRFRDEGCDKPFTPERTPQEAAEKFTRDNPAVISNPRPKATAVCNQCNGVGTRGFAGRCRKCNGSGIVEI